ncbi:hypothetical protein RUM43_013800 [Polyplax serrata]|uniref:Tetratricopeptide repeat protein 7 N-terminal domain-containing protein n=1 Tax=Polyplax serrata TaxID=468196 RepID=A0AAN8S9K8_POLSC
MIGTGSHLFFPGSHSPQPPTPARQIGAILETALQRAPLLYIKTSKLDQAVARYRSMLSAVESSATQSLRLTLTRQLAEVLLRGLTGALYIPPAPSLQSNKKAQVNVSESPWKPKQYTGFNLFIPKVDYEEIILLLLISEAMAVRDTVLSQAPEFEEARLSALKNAKAVYDLLAVTVIRWGQASILNEVLERAMKFSFEEKHIWMQHALCLITMGKHFHALAVLKEVRRLMPDKVIPCLMASRICFENLERPIEGIEWCTEALKRATANEQHLLSRCLLYIGIGHHIQSQQSYVRMDKKKLSESSRSYFSQALECDPNDHLAEYYMALYNACNFEICDAIKHAKNALGFQPEHAPSLQLLVLLLSAQKQYDEASNLLDAALEEYPDDLNLLNVKAHLELFCKGGEVALVTAQHMLSVWRVLYEDQTIMDAVDTSDKRSDTKSTFQLYATEMSDKDSSSLHAQSIAASRVEHALSEVASSLSSFTPRPGPQHAWVLQVQIWLLLAEIYIEMDELHGASACLQEATSIYPLSHQVMYMRGLLHEKKREFNEARQWFQNAVAINPTHVKSLQHLGLIYHYLGYHRLAEKTLRDAARIDPNACMTWYNLGIVLEAMGEYEGAGDCMVTALDVETCSPILPFTIIPLTFE